MANGQREEETSIYVYSIREVLKEKVAMGDVKSIKHHPNVK